MEQSAEGRNTVETGGRLEEEIKIGTNSEELGSPALSPRIIEGLTG